MIHTSAKAALHQDKKRILILGGGAREHALAQRLAMETNQVLVAPGNAGTAQIAENHNVNLEKVDEIVELASRQRVDFVVVGPERPLTLGVVDALHARGICAFGPSSEAARLEGSKAFMKQFALRHKIPTAPFRIFYNSHAARAYVTSANHTMVIKADGLAAGKGVFLASNREEALAAIQSIMEDRIFGESGNVVVIEEMLEGQEISFHVVSDGKRYVPLITAQDHKRIGDGNLGPNTGGMGAYAPVPFVTESLYKTILTAIIEPTLRGMAKEGIPFRGALFAGLMIQQGKPMLLEYNVRFGDPEAIVILPFFTGSWTSLLEQAARGDLRSVQGEICQGGALCIVMASEGYPTLPRLGDRIEGLNHPLEPEVSVFHAGTAYADGEIVTAGGRVLTVGAFSTSLQDASSLAYKAVSHIRWKGEYHRSDIGRSSTAAF
ncbi:phosphoribosylamine--glycine ligase [Pajaroellobacter abortibovis]|uniref:Phosphoribosylamine--glycine ligase n=2 Tax=Pajaroellobacter abortibovis TaxID=1882918 RepID=A0A1L6MZQ3_9BACT|nr:phosphoribosylamine--glycine ligase [Pajaroellobacter abortibovis]